MGASDLLADPVLASVPVHRGYKVLGGVVLYQKLGQGGMGAVYRGRHLRLDIDVAVKVMSLPTGLTPEQSDNFTRRFLREAKTAASITHQNLVGVIDVNTEGGIYFLVMDYVEGESAADRLKRKGVLSEQEAVEMCLGAGEGLAAAHRKGIVHRDVKPDNILLDKDGTVRVADLGLAKAYSGGESDAVESMGLSMTQQAMGTPLYMSPEQFASARHVGPAADVWSLGVTLYQLLTGRLPWSDSNPFALAAKITNDPLPDIRETGAALSSGVAAVIRKAVQKDPDARYADCGEMGEALRDHLASIRGPERSVLPDAEAGAARLALLPTSPPPEKTLTLIGMSVFGGARLELKAHGWLSRLCVRFPGARRPAAAVAIAVLVLVAVAAWLGKSLLHQADEGIDAANLQANLTGRLDSPTQGPSDAAGVASGNLDAREARKTGPVRTFAANLAGVVVEMVYVEAGSFTMGSDRGNLDERPAYEVLIGKGFFIGRYEVTRGQFAAFIRETGYKTDAEKDGSATVWTAARGYEEKQGASWKEPTYVQGDDHPVVCVSWNDANTFCRWMGVTIGRTCRLPTEAEWEYACRARSTGKWCFGGDESRLGEYAWYQDNSSRSTHPVGRKRANSWGLYDMHGNVWEWCQDWYGGEYYRTTRRKDPTGPREGKDRVLRGGSWCDSPGECRCSHRDGYQPRKRYADTGFRVVMPQGPE